MKRSKYDELFSRHGEKGICKQCGKELPWSRETGTNPLLHHLKTIHAQEWKAFDVKSAEAKKKKEEIEAAVASTQCKLPFVPRSPSVSQKASITLTPSEFCSKFDKEVARLVCYEALPISFVESTGFKRFVNEVIPGTRLKSRGHMADKAIPALHKEVAAAIKDKIGHADSIALTVDGWSSSGNKHHLCSVTGHFLDIDGQPKCVVIGAKSMTGAQTAQNYVSKVMQSLEDFEIPMEKVVAIVRDGATTMESMCNLLEVESSHCLAHVLQLAVKDGLTCIPGWDQLVEKLKTISRKLRKSRQSLDNFMEILQCHDVPARLLTKHTDVRWNSMYIMLTRYLDARAAVEHFLLDNETFPQLCRDEWELMGILRELLKPLAEATETVQNRYFATLGSVIPLVRVITHKLEGVVTSKEQLKKAKRDLLQSLETRTTKFFRSDLHRMATITDPRFKNAFFYESFKDSFCGKLTTAASPSETDDAEANTPQTDDPRQESSTIFDEFLTAYGSRTCVSPVLSNADLEFSIKKEIDQYLSSPPSIRCCPFKFWRENAHLYPNIYMHAKKYLCIPASSAESERVFSGAGLILTNKRTRLLPETLDRLLICHQNMRMLDD